jgi:hypothetical protein
MHVRTVMAGQSSREGHAIVNVLKFDVHCACLAMPSWHPAVGSCHDQSLLIMVGLHMLVSNTQPTVIAPPKAAAVDCLQRNGL